MVGREAEISCGGTSSDERLRAEADSCAIDATAGKRAAGIDAAASGPIAAASAHEIVADAIGPFGGSIWTGLLASCE